MPDGYLIGLRLRSPVSIIQSLSLWFTFHMVWQVTVSLTSSYSSEIVVNFKKVKRQTCHQLQGFRFFKLVKAKTLNFI